MSRFLRSVNLCASARLRDTSGIRTILASDKLMAEPPVPTKRQFIWKIGVLYWGGLMFLFFTIVGPLIPHFTMGKPLTLELYIGNAITSLVTCFFGGMLFGWVMWWSLEWKRKRMKL